MPGSRYDASTKAKAIRLVREHAGDYPTQWAAITAVSPIWAPLIVALAQCLITDHRRAAFVSLVAGVVYFPWEQAVLHGGAAPGWGEMLGLAAWLTALAAVIELVRARRDQTREAARVAAETLQRQAAEERVRIARDLHDRGRPPHVAHQHPGRGGPPPARHPTQQTAGQGGRWPGRQPGRRSARRRHRPPGPPGPGHHQGHQQGRTGRAALHPRPAAPGRRTGQPSPVPEPGPPR